MCVLPVISSFSDTLIALSFITNPTLLSNPTSASSLNFELASSLKLNLTSLSKFDKLDPALLSNLADTLFAQSVNTKRGVIGELCIGTSAGVRPGTGREDNKARLDKSIRINVAGAVAKGGVSITGSAKKSRANGNTRVKPDKKAGADFGYSTNKRGRSSP